MKTILNIFFLLLLSLFLQIDLLAQEELLWLNKSRNEIIDKFGYPNRKSFSQNQLLYDIGKNSSRGFYIEGGTVEFLTLTTIFPNYNEANAELNNYATMLVNSYGWKLKKEENSYNLTKPKVKARVILLVRSVYTGGYIFSKEFTRNMGNETPIVPSGKPNYDISRETNIEFLKKLDGRYFDETKLFSNTVFTTRIKNLVGANRFKYLKGIWQVTSPMKFHDNIFLAEGCQAHNCGWANAVIVVNLSTNTMYVGIREESNIKTYSEKGDLPIEITKWVKGNELRK